MQWILKRTGADAREVTNVVVACNSRNRPCAEYYLRDAHAPRRYVLRMGRQRVAPGYRPLLRGNATLRQVRRLLPQLANRPPHHPPRRTSHHHPIPSDPDPLTQVDCQNPAQSVQLRRRPPKPTHPDSGCCVKLRSSLLVLALGDPKNTGILGSRGTDPAKARRIRKECLRQRAAECDRRGTGPCAVRARRTTREIEYAFA